MLVDAHTGASADAGSIPAASIFSRYQRFFDRDDSVDRAWRRTVIRRASDVACGVAMTRGCPRPDAPPVGPSLAAPMQLRRSKASLGPCEQLDGDKRE